MTVLQTLAHVGPTLGRTQLQTILGGFRFSGEDVDKKTSVLSGGERSRLALARMLTAPASFLLLDEPTNHLDMQSCAVLAAALEDYEGAICVISHDRDFLDGFVNRVWDIDNGARTEYLGNYSDYEWKKSHAAAQAALRLQPSQSERNGKTAKPTKASKRREAEARNRRAKARNPLRKKLAGLEGRLEIIMGQKEDLDQVLAGQELYLDANKVKLMDTLAHYKKLGADEDLLLEEIEHVTEELELME